MLKISLSWFNFSKWYEWQDIIYVESARSQLLLLFNDGFNNTALLSWFLLKIRSLRILDTIVCSEPLVSLFSPAWIAVKVTLPGGWLHLSFRVHRPYLFRSDDCNCLELAPGLMFDYFLPIPDAESLPFYHLVLKLVLCVCWKSKSGCLPMIAYVTACWHGSIYFPFFFFSLAPYFTCFELDLVRIWSNMSELHCSVSMFYAQTAAQLHR